MLNLSGPLGSVAEVEQGEWLWEAWKGRLAVKSLFQLRNRDLSNKYAPPNDEAGCRLSVFGNVLPCGQSAEGQALSSPGDTQTHTVCHHAGSGQWKEIASQPGILKRSFDYVMAVLRRVTKEKSRDLNVRQDADVTRDVGERLLP